MVLAAFVVGYSKTALGGLAVVAVAIFASIMPAKESTAAILAILIVGDLVACWHYRRDADWSLIRRLLPEGLYGAMVSFEIRGAQRDGIFDFLDRLKLVVRATSLGDVHTMVLYPMMSSHREVPTDLRDRMGIRENLVRLSTGIEDMEDVEADLDQALA